MVVTSADKLAEGFKKPTILPIVSKPTHATIHAIHNLLNLNTASVNTNLGCVMLGHLCLALSPTVYMQPSRKHGSCPL